MRLDAHDGGPRRRRDDETPKRASSVAPSHTSSAIQSPVETHTAGSPDQRHENAPHSNDVLRSDGIAVWSGVGVTLRDVGPVGAHGEDSVCDQPVSFQRVATERDHGAGAEFQSGAGVRRGGRIRTTSPARMSGDMDPEPMSTGSRPPREAEEHNCCGEPHHAVEEGGERTHPETRGDPGDPRDRGHRGCAGHPLNTTLPAPLVRCRRCDPIEEWFPVPGAPGTTRMDHVFWASQVNVAVVVRPWAPLSSCRVTSN